MRAPALWQILRAQPALLRVDFSYLSDEIRSEGRMARSARSKKTKGIGKHANIPSYHQSLSLDEDPTDETVVTPFLDIYLRPGIKGRRSRRLRRPHKDSNRHAKEREFIRRKSASQPIRRRQETSETKRSKDPPFPSTYRSEIGFPISSSTP